MKPLTSRTPVLAFLLGLVFLAATPVLPAAMPPVIGAIEDVGDGTLRITCSGQSKFTRNTTRLKDAATAEATRYCNERGKHLKVISTSEHKGMYLVGEMPSFTLVFKPVDALEAMTAAAAAAVASPGTVDTPVAVSGDFYAMLLKLDDLRKKGILTEDEFQAEKKKILSHLK